MLAAAVFGALFGCWLAAMIPLALWGAILAGGVLLERWRYQLLARDRPGRDWVATLERFVGSRDRPAGHGVLQPDNRRTALCCRRQSRTQGASLVGEGSATRDELT